jgi:signal transduction histidine kinase
VFQRLQLKHRQLAGRTRDLLRANEELARAARTSAIGSVAAHLIHGLKNPLSGLHQFVRGQTSSPAAGDDPAWHDAVASTRRMQEMVAEVVRVLREEEQGDAYELSLAELGSVVRQRLEPHLRELGVSLSLATSGDGALDNRQANLVTLILTNLLQNAVHATPRGGMVTLEMKGRQGRVQFRVSDQGGGLPEAIRRDLFAPCRSTRDGGTGIGLAISRQLAGHLGAELQLESSSPTGTVFVLELPLRQTAANSPLDEPVLRT